MKIFAVYAKVELTQKPDWLDDFRKKFDKPYEYHITLKQSCVVDKNQVPDIKTKLNGLFASLEIPDHKILLTFDSLKINKKNPDDVCVMIMAAKNEEICKLQKDILSALKEYNQYYKARHQEYEENFEPHITIARDLDEQAYLEASKELEKDYTCEGAVTRVVLVVVNNANAAEANDPNNQTIYKL